jgi:Ca-activated chloride channel family protein
VAVALIAVGVLIVSTVSAHGAEAPRSERGAGDIARPGEATRGTLLFKAESQTVPHEAPLLKTDVRMTISGIVARVAVRQEFRNPAPEWAEGLYVFPLPETAAVDHFHMEVGGRIIEGIVQERGEAKQRYEQAKAEGKRAGLVEQERPNVFTTSVANIGPGETIVVTIQYQETVRYDQGSFRLRFPMVVGPRYIAGSPLPQRAGGGTGWAPDTGEVSDASRITPPVRRPSNGAINPVSLLVDLAPGFRPAQIESPYHAIAVQQGPGNRYAISLTDAVVPADRDFELIWRPAAGEGPTAAVFTEEKDGEQFALIVLLPPGLSARERTSVPRETVFVIDTSGSMHGESLEQATAALHVAIDTLAPDSLFNIIQFNSWTDSLFPASVPATRSNLDAALRYVARLAAQGGTEMLPALQRALDGAEHGDRVRQVIFLTDGAVGNEEALFTTIAQRLGGSRLFTIGIGSAPNSHFMRSAAELGRGTFTYIGKPSDVREKMDALFRKLEHPALTDIAVELPAGTPADLLPARIPDLYLGEPLIVAVKTDRMPAGMAVHGRYGHVPWRIDFRLDDAGGREGVAAFWARHKIDGLIDAARFGSQPDVVRKQVIDLALKHHLVSRYTSLVAVDVTPARPEGQALNSHAMKTNLPHGWNYEHVFGLPQTATSAPLHLLVGMACVILALLAWWSVRPHAA